MKRALVTGIYGQDGIFLTEKLLNEGYSVVGISRKLHSKSLLSPHPNLQIIAGDIRDHLAVEKVIKEAQFSEIYNLAAKSSVAESFVNPDETYEINTKAAINIFETALIHSPQSRIFHASSSEMFGSNQNLPFREDSEFKPVSPYAKSKVEAHIAAEAYIEQGLFISRGIMFNHESELRPRNFISSKLVNEFRAIASGVGKTFTLGNIEVKRDWSYAKDFTNLMPKTLNILEPESFIMASGKSHSVRELAIAIKNTFELPLSLESYIQINESDFRINEILDSIGDATKAKKQLDWQPEYSFERMVRQIVIGQRTC